MNTSTLDITLATSLTALVTGGLVISGIASALVVGSIVGGMVVLATR